MDLGEPPEDGPPDATDEPPKSDARVQTLDDVGGDDDDDLKNRICRQLFGRVRSSKAALIAGKYQLLTTIGRGSMGEVVRARAAQSDQRVAVKLLKGCDHISLKAAERLKREASTLAALRHPNIVAIHEYGVAADGRIYIVMQLVEGRSLKEHLASGKPIDGAKARQILEQVADAVAHAHANSIVHRDLSPGNILLTQEDERVHATVIDFGLARCVDDDGTKLTGTGDLLGTPRYMSPEQATGEEATRASDVYALGCIAYEMLTGVPAAAGRTLAEVLEQQKSGEPPRFAEVAPDRRISAELEQVVRRALNKDPRDRYPSMAAFRDALAAIDQPKPAAPARSPRRGALALTLVLGALAAIALALPWS